MKLTGPILIAVGFREAGTARLLEV